MEQHLLETAVQAGTRIHLPPYLIVYIIHTRIDIQPQQVQRE
jgi:hypothetical protein